MTVPPAVPAPRVKPLLKWAGGKRQLLPELRRFYPSAFGAYIEPFFGSGAVFFDLHSSGALDGRRVELIDSNPDLIGCYQAVAGDPDAVGASLDALAEAHAADSTSHYYEVRDRRFNPAREAARRADGRIAYTPALAAMLIYLNRTGFNGLFRVNARGRFNVPAGRYARPRIADRSRLHEVAAALSGSGVTLRWGSFETARSLARRGDFLYFDPPYAPLSPTASFNTYTTPRFEAAHQRQLQELVVVLAERGCHVLLSNSTAELIAELYERDPSVTRAGLHALRIPARRAINSNAARRGAVEEYLITNLRPRE